VGKIVKHNTGVLQNDKPRKTLFLLTRHFTCH